mmetsp:Transcript_34272/g.57525  ORF Transcript_34272/g.57525 Transcript_34272/m.57525 type:complete len:238 (+) Transcript_34272:134-847(+)
MDSVEASATASTTTTTTPSSSVSVTPPASKLHAASPAVRLLPARRTLSAPLDTSATGLLLLASAPPKTLALAVPLIPLASRSALMDLSVDPCAQRPPTETARSSTEPALRRPSATCEDSATMRSEEGVSEAASTTNAPSPTLIAATTSRPRSSSSTRGSSVFVRSPAPPRSPTTLPESSPSLDPRSSSSTVPTDTSSSSSSRTGITMPSRPPAPSALSSSPTTPPSATLPLPTSMSS